jgi:hypothetical protein
MIDHIHLATIPDEEKNIPASRHVKTTRLLSLGPASMSLTSFARTVVASPGVTFPITSQTSSSAPLQLWVRKKFLSVLEYSTRSKD